MKKNKFVTVLLLAMVLILLSGCGKVEQGKSDNSIKEETYMSNENTPKAEGALSYTYQLQPPVKGDTIAVMTTSMGEIKIKLFSKEAPKAVENFVKHSKDGYYNGLIFHRVIKDFMIQGGDPAGNGTGGQSIWGKPFQDEFNDQLHNFRGALSMANSGPNTNGSQFFIVQNTKMNDNLVAWMRQNGFKQELIDTYVKVGGTPWLDNHHTVFGQVFEGIDVVDKITGVKVDQNNKPLQEVKITKIEIATQE